MNICVTVRYHLENEDADVKQLQKITNELFVAKQIRQDYLFCLRIAYRPNFLNNPKNVYNLKKSVVELLGSNIRFLLEPSVGPSASLLQALFDGVWAFLSTKKSPVIFIIDGDGQFRLDNEMLLNNLSELARWMIESKSTYGCGARTHICLGEGDAGVMREIHETIINMLATKVGKVDARNVTNLSLGNVPLAYKKFGDTLSGICAINWKSPNFWSIYKSILDMSEKLNFSHFASHFYLALKGAKLDRVCSIYVPTNLRQPTKQWSVEDVESMIKTQSAILLKTDVGNEFKNVINNHKTVEDVSKFYPKDLVVHVINLVKSVTKIKA
jgi:hypothetical protein